MNIKLLTAAGALLLLATAITPAVVGHDDKYLCPNPTAPPLGGKKVCGVAGSAGHGYPTVGWPPHDEDGVAGRYVGAAGPAYAPDAYNNPQNTLAAGGILCDGEVVIDDNTFPGNEEAVDGVGTFGEQLDNTWDDGGQGGACHYRTFMTPEFNTPGCPGGHSVRGTNVAGGDIFLAASCDWKHSTGGNSSPENPLLICLVNSVLAFNPLPLLAETGVFVDCVEEFIHCAFFDPTSACHPSRTEACGSDGTLDGIDFGYGWGTGGATATFPGPTLTAQIAPGPPPTVVACPQALMTESIFVFDTVATNTGVYVDPDGSPDGFDPVFVPTAPPEIYPAGSGQIWTILWNIP